MQGQHHQQAAQRKQRPHGMPLDERRRFPDKPLCGRYGLFGGFGGLLGGFPRLALILPFQLWRCHNRAAALCASGCSCANLREW